MNSLLQGPKRYQAKKIDLTENTSRTFEEVVTGTFHRPFTKIDKVKFVKSVKQVDRLFHM